MRKLIILALLVVALLACSSEPSVIQCQHFVDNVVKRSLNYPASFDEHSGLTISLANSDGRVSGNKEDGWRIHAPLIFGAQNAFGVKSDYIAWYWVDVDADSNCSNIRVGEIFPYY